MVVVLNTWHERKGAQNEMRKSWIDDMILQSLAFD